MAPVMITDDDRQTAKSIVEVEPYTFTVPSRSRPPEVHVVTAIGLKSDGGALRFDCTCEAAYLGRRRLKRPGCRHVMATVAFLGREAVWA